jgi:hypothetical protein
MCKYNTKTRAGMPGNMDGPSAAGQDAAGQDVSYHPEYSPLKKALFPLIHLILL